MDSESKQKSLLTSHGTLEFESKEAAQDLLPLLAESGQIVPCIKVIFDRKMDKKVYGEILTIEANKKGTEIKRICNDNYTDFIDAIDQLLGVQLSVTQLNTKINELNGNIKAKGNHLTDKIDTLIRLKKVRRNMDIAINRLNRMKYILSLMKKITELINNKKYIAALKNLNQLTTQIIQLKGSAITQEIFSALPKYTDRIKKAVKLNFSEWLHNMNKESKKLGTVAISKTKAYLNTIDNENEDAVHPFQAVQDQMKVALQRQFGSQANLLNADSVANLANIEQKHNTDTADGNQSLFEKIEKMDFNPVYQCIHVHETLQSLEEFKATYIEQRLMMKDDIIHKMKLVNLSAYSSIGGMAAMFAASQGGGAGNGIDYNAAQINTQLDPSKVSDEESHLNREFFSSLCGFFVMEHAVCSRYQQLMDSDELQHEWSSALTYVCKRLKHEVIEQAKSPYELIEVKYELYVLGKSIENYDFKITGITAFLEDLRIKFETTLHSTLLRQTKKILSQDAFTPLVITTEDEWSNIEEFGLNVNLAKSHDAENNQQQGNNRKTVNKKSKIEQFRDQINEKASTPALAENVELPQTVPFSISVIIICQSLCDLIEQYQMYAKYLSDMSSHIRNAVQKGIVKIVSSEIQKIIMGTKDVMSGGGMDDEKQNRSQQARKGTERRRVGIAELAQLAVNTAYLERACGFFEKELYEENANQEFLDEQEIVIPKLHEAREELGNLQQTCVGSMVEHLGSKIDSLMRGYMSNISWTPDRANAGPQQWARDIIAFLNVNVRDKLKYLGSEHRDSAFFIAATSINRYLVKILTSDGSNDDEMMFPEDYNDGNDNNSDFTYVKKYNILSIYNLSVDMQYLEMEAKKTHIDRLTESYKQIRQICSLLLSGKQMTKYLDEDFRMMNYGYVSAANLRSLLEKYNTLGIFTKKNLSKDMNKIAVDKGTIKNMLKSLKDMD